MRSCLNLFATAPFNALNINALNVYNYQRRHDAMNVYLTAYICMTVCGIGVYALEYTECSEMTWNSRPIICDDIINCIFYSKVYQNFSKRQCSVLLVRDCYIHMKVNTRQDFHTIIFFQRLYLAVVQTSSSYMRKLQLPN